MAKPVSAIPSPDGASPAMAQWFSLKAEHPDALLFFRMGDFFELFFSDAEAAAAALDIALTARGTHAGAPIPMCGVPVAAAPAYLARLIRRGFRVAIAEQTEKPQARSGKQPLARAVVRLVTAGTLTEDELLEAGRSNLLLALVADKAGLGAAWIDISTGAFSTALVPAQRLPDLLGRLDPAEILANEGVALGEHAARRSSDGKALSAEQARSRLAEAFGAASLEAFGTFMDTEARAACLALDYIRATQAGALPRLARPVAENPESTLAIDPATRASLDLLRARDGGTGHTLFATVCRTLTAAGSRALAAWIAAPLTDPTLIAARQEAWCWLIEEVGRAGLLRTALRGAPDMMRALGRLSVGRGQPRDLACLRAGLLAAAEARAALDDASGTHLPALLEHARHRLSEGSALAALLTCALSDDLPARLEDGGAIAVGFDGELDAHRRLRDESRKVIAGLQNDYAQRFGVASLKIRHHVQLGYVIEVGTAQAAGLRDRADLAFRQGTSSAARFSTAELADLDRRIAEAAERALVRERLVFASLVEQALAEPALAHAAEALALLDVVQSCAALAQPSAQAGSWCRAEVTNDLGFVLHEARHPVVEQALAALGGRERFTANDCDLSPDRRVLLLTGPNMAGKSTYLRQVALCVILAQAGLPVPARAARIGVVDRLFSRVGASDDLARGRSTFMVEMTETAAILNQGGPRSLVVVDEIGRGTATLDGLAIAWAVLEALHGALRCRAIFATHFHELADLAGSLPRLRPHTMKVREWKGQLVFQHEVIEGNAGRSWGVHVARLAGVPEAVVARAARLLSSLERNSGPRPSELPLFSGLSAEAPAVADSPQPLAEQDPVHAALSALDVDNLSPREALAALYDLKQRVAALHDDCVPATPDALHSR